MEINKANGFTVLADETTDISCTAKFSIFSTYYNADTKKICEHFLQFVPVICVTGKILATARSSWFRFKVS